MSKYSQAVIDDLLQHLDALDVLELIDYHPESIQRTGDVVKSFCPICQDHSGRYLTVHLDTRKFESTPPHMPEQRGTLVDLYARCRRMDFDRAMEELAEEFGILLTEPTSAKDDPSAVLKEAIGFLEKAEKGSGRKDVEEAEKRLRRVLDAHPGNLEATRLLFRIRLMEKNIVTLTPVTMRLLELEARDPEALSQAARAHLKLFPQDIQVRQRLADALVEAGRTSEAVEELMALAEANEVARLFDQALAVYRRIEGLGEHGVDVHPLVMNLLLSRRRKDDAAAELRKRSLKLREQQRFPEALHAMTEALGLRPEDDDLRVGYIEAAISVGLDEDAVDLCLTHVDAMLDAEHLDRAVEALSYLAADQPNNPLILEMLATTYRRMGEEEAAGELQFRLVDVYRAAGDQAAARLILEELIAKNPDSTRALTMEAEFEFEDGDRQAATRHLQRALEIQTRDQDVDGALSTCNRLLAIDPDALEIHELKLDLLALHRSPKEVRAEARAVAQLLKDKGQDARLVKILENVVLSQPDFLEGLQLLSEAAERSGNAARAALAQRQQVQVLVGKGDLGEAEALGRTLIARDPAQAVALTPLVEIALAKGDRAKAEAVLKQQAAALRKANQPATLRGVLEGLVRLLPEDDVLAQELAATYEQLGDQAGGVAILERQLKKLRSVGKDWKGIAEAGERLLSAQPSHLGAHEALIEAYEKLGNAERILRVYEGAIGLQRERGASKEEAALLREYVRRNPGQEKPQQRLITLLLGLGSKEEALERLNALLNANTATPDKNIRFLRELIKEAPGISSLHRRLADIFKAMGRIDDMVAEMQTVVEIYEKQGRFRDAIELFQKVLKDVPESLSTRAGLIDALKRNRMVDEAIKQYLIYARQLQKARKTKEAMQAFEEMYELDSQNEEVIKAHAALLRDTGDLPQANKRLRDLATVYASQGKTEKAISVLREIVDGDPGNIELRREIITLKRESGQQQQAVDELNQLADLLAQQGNVDGALEARREAISIMPRSPELRQRLVKQLQDLGRREEAQLEQLELAQTYSSAGMHDKGLSILELVLKENPQNIAARRARAKIYDASGDEKRALAEYRELQQYIEGLPAPRTSTPVPVAAALPDAYPGLEIIPEYEFSTYIVGAKNSFAFATAKAVAEHPGSARNPLFLYAEVGLGKTHLLQAIANALKKKNPGVRILYSSMEYFTSELIDAIQNNTITQFRQKHLNCDVLLLDDVQFLAGKERAQEEFFHIFNMLYQKSRQIVVTSDRPPKDIAHLGMRLRSRFGQGVIVDIQPPDFETRVAILRAEAAKRHIVVPEDVMALLAERVSANVRELKGAFNQLLTQHEIGGDPLDTRTANAIVDKFFAA